MTIRVLIADDQSVVRTGLSTILSSQADIEVVGQAADGAEAVALARTLRPDEYVHGALKAGARKR